ncbi:MAG: hypothetical protein HYW01_10110 [Deltaproteobacteria bacterium]|nr:hypothetical protein [Deltaproteobacteria bacterium]
MNKLIRAGAIGLLLLPLFLAVNSQAQSRNTQIEELKRQMEEIQRQNQQQIDELRRKVEELEAQKQADQKKIEKLAIQKEEEDKDAWWRNIMMEYKKPGDGLTIKTKDGNYKMRFRMRGQFQFSVNDTDQENTATDFRVRRLRLLWDGNAFRPWLLYYIQLDVTDDLVLRDMYFDIAYNTMFAPRVGQYKVPFSREELNSSSELQLVERSIVNDEFAFGRDRGASIYGVLGNYITYGAGIFNGDGRNGVSADSNLLYAGRIMFTPCCGELKYGGTFPAGGDYKIEPNFGEDKPLIAFGAAFAVIPGLNIGNKTPDNDIDVRFDEIFGGAVIDAGGAEADVFALTADVNFKYSIFSAEAEYQFRNLDPDGAFEEATDHGFRVQGGLFIVPEFIEVAGRFAYIAFDDDIDGRESRYEITPGLNFYLSNSHKWKVQLSYSFIKDEDTDGGEIDQNVLRAQLQAYF